MDLSHFRSQFLLLLLLCACLLSPAGGAAARDEVSLKAAIVYRLLGFAGWPPGAFAGDDAPLTVCVFEGPEGRGPYGLMEGREVDGHPLRVLMEPADLQTCQVLFIGQTMADQQARLLRVIGSRPILSISDIPGFSAAGGIITLVRRGGHFSFQINRLQARHRGISLAAPLLQMADIVED